MLHRRAGRNDRGGIRARARFQRRGRLRLRGVRFHGQVRHRHDHHHRGAISGRSHGQGRRRDDGQERECGGRCADERRWRGRPSFDGEHNDRHGCRARTLRRRERCRNYVLSPYRLRGGGQLRLRSVRRSGQVRYGHHRHHRDRRTGAAVRRQTHRKSHPGADSRSHTCGAGTSGNAQPNVRAHQKDLRLDHRCAVAGSHGEAESKAEGSRDTSAHSRSHS
mmetsp:Transcript_2731/g.6855  ORF Transcript_2731/g.6855 Transcript_2731/m.6855 type:complete len:221 (+) Transcript_2731:2073-2735(+)